MADPADRSLERAHLETVIMVAIFFVCLLWTLGYCGLAGYGEKADPESTTLGMPTWIFVGVLVPWVLASIATVVFSLRFMTDDEPSEGRPDA